MRFWIVKFFAGGLSQGGIFQASSASEAMAKIREYWEDADIYLVKEYDTYVRNSKRKD